MEYRFSSGVSNYERGEVKLTYLRVDQIKMFFPPFISFVLIYFVYKNTPDS